MRTLLGDLEGHGLAPGRPERLLTAYPVYVLLIRLGVKSGMADPREAA